MLSQEERDQRRLEHREARYQLLDIMLSRGREPVPEPRKEPADIPLILICVTIAAFALSCMIFWSHHVPS
jgi:hypothetical protein